jgi:hypothetical protein
MVNNDMPVNAMTIQDFFVNVAAHILSITVLSFIAASFFFSTTYVFIFIFKSYDPEGSEEQNALLDSSKLNAADTVSESSREESQESSFSGYIQLALFALVYSVIQAGWFNSNKVLMQLSWRSDDVDDPLEQVYRTKISQPTVSSYY